MRVRILGLYSLIAFLLLAASAVAQTPSVTPTPGGDCCSIHPGPSCDIPACAACVCEDQEEPLCCVDGSPEGWDRICLAFAESDDCAEVCLCGEPPTPTPTPGGDCCLPHAGSRCDDEACTTCVCDRDSNCCTGPWDAFCVESARTVDECASQCSACTPLPTIPPLATPTPGPCCEGRDLNPGCEESTCESCVCAVDANCCLDTWDELCAVIAVEECAIDCVCVEDGDCCSGHDGFGCNDRRCQECVIALDPDCGEQWDDNCASEARLECALDCTCGDCCAANPDEVPGCGVKPCQDCVCEIDEECCTELWDAQCDSIARDECSLDCPCLNCCEEQVVPGCGEKECQTCVCALDANCCDEVWDGICAARAVEECDRRCECEAGSNCCIARPTETGCDESACEACVCGVDDFCCTDLWDSTCSDEITVNECAAECSCDPGSCVGDCDGDGEVSIGSLIRCVGVALGNSPVSECRACDADGDGEVSIGELIQAVGNALEGC